MSDHLAFDFIVDSAKSQIQISRNFSAPLDMIWDIWTKPFYLDQWWAPKPYRTETLSMTFEPGGRWHYAMVSPDDEKHWCLADYESIQTNEKFTYTDAFCDENGLINPNHPRTAWTVSFKPQEGENATVVHIELQYQSLADLEKILGMGIREGLSMALTNLDELLLL
jgi:uncharacterized protein YndB with AHSA1/START domain